ncbi:unnamed protein product [Paramecium sonneborni]|uniref:Insulin-like growth factor binding protein, N-terminal n=1 Tax=Paramecium sonneborni TaxID=65129 RepID=A0A8S1QZA8_9CILI|nr:unnamed protein product [Paramecium sonneborni]
MFRLIFYLTLLLVFQRANCVLNSVYEEFNNKQIVLTTNWICKGSSTHPTSVFTCSKGMDLVELKDKNQPCHQILNTIDTILPHFRIQLYIDIYSYYSIDENEYFRVEILENSFHEDLYLQTASGQNLQQCSTYNEKLSRKSYLKELPHSQQQVKLQLQSTANEQFINESFLFRNVQLILERCYKTCKTCSGEGKEQCLSCYDDIILSNNSCDSCKNKLGQNFLQIPGGCQNKCNNNQDYDEDQVCIENINIQFKCEVDCEQCTYTQRCLICKPQKYLYFGQCIDKCPNYTIVNGTNCLSNIDILQKNKNLRITELVREFHDLSTTKSSTNAIFQMISTTTNNEYSFQKGVMIFIIAIFRIKEYLEDHQFGLMHWTQEFLFIRIFFEVIVGDIELCKNKFKYKFNDQEQESLTLNSTYQGNNLNIDDQKWPNNYILYLYKVDKSINYQISTNKELTLEIACQNDNQLGFCGIQNMVVVGLSNCLPEYNFDLYYYETGRNPCIPICGDKITVGDEQCDDGNNDPFDGCFNCRYQCEDHCSNCVYGQCIVKKIIQKSFEIQIEMVEYILSYDLDVVQLSCIFQCSICIKNLCLQCNYGYYLNTYNNLCESVEDQSPQKVNQIQLIECGNGIIEGFEQCDDQNIINDDDCDNFCKLSCYPNCEICINGFCVKCEIGWILGNMGCQSICGDSQIQDHEQCDDGNSDDYDGCSKCELIQYEKCDKGMDIQQYHCAVCHYGKCIKCNDGFLLDGDLCVQICGDGLLNLQEEECDVQRGDGCIDCKIQDGYVCGKLNYSICNTCDTECTQCISLDKINLICKSCLDGYYPVEYKCQQCDSNCITCNFQSNLCTSCYRPDCDHCESIPGLYSDQTTKKCNSICGDGIVVEKYEQCDDYNQNNGDGCDSQCNLEISDQEVNQIKDYQSYANNTYHLKLITDYQFKILCNTANITIDNMDIQDYNYNCTQIDILTCNLQFDFKKSIYKFNTIHAIIQYTNSINRLLFEVRSVQYDITPSEYIVLEKNNQKQKEYIQSAQQSFSLTFLLLIPISIIFNLFNCLWAVLEILSWINNFYFLNVNYPFNVELFFLNSDWSNLIGFPTYQGLNQPDCNYYFEAPKRFKDKGIDPLFFNNIQTPFMFLLTFIIIFLINYLFYSFFSLLDNTLKRKISQKDKKFSIFNIQIKKQGCQNQIKVQQQMVVQNPYMKYITNLLERNSVNLIKQFKQTISLCLLDITLAILLQLSYSKNNSNIIVGFNQFVAIITIGIIIFQLYMQYQILNIHKLKAKNKHFEELYGVYYENINIENSFGYYYEFFGQISKILYIFFMVNSYSTPILQVTLCYLSSSLNFVFLLYQNPYHSKKEYVIQLILNFCISFIIFIVISFAINDQINVEFIEKNKNTLGWIIIALVILAILTEFCILIFGLLKRIFEIFKSLWNLIKKDKIQNNSNQHQEEQFQQQEIQVYTKNISTNKVGSQNLRCQIVLF